MLRGEHSAIPSTCIKLLFVIKMFVLSIIEWPLKTGFTVVHFNSSSQRVSEESFSVHSSQIKNISVCLIGNLYVGQTHPLSAVSCSVEHFPPHTCKSHYNENSNLMNFKG